MVDKEEYRKNREAGLRGQGPYPNPVIGRAKSDDPKTHGAVGTRKARRNIEAHGTGRARRAANRG